MSKDLSRKDLVAFQNPKECLLEHEQSIAIICFYGSPLIDEFLEDRGDFLSISVSPLPITGPIMCSLNVCLIRLKPHLINEGKQRVYVRAYSVQTNFFIPH